VVTVILLLSTVKSAVTEWVYADHAAAFANFHIDCKSSSLLKICLEKLTM
jgi:hypothetical protein